MKYNDKDKNINKSDKINEDREYRDSIRMPNKPLEEKSKSKEKDKKDK